MNSLKKLRPLVFLPAFLLLLLTVILNFISYEWFLRITTVATTFMTNEAGWVFSLVGVTCVLLIVFAYFSPLGNVKIGGPKAKPILKKKTWFAITLTTTIAAGILFWGTAEPINHLTSPPASLGIEPMSPEAAVFAMETMYLHWTFIPYAFYSVPTIVFAFAYYNMKRSFSVGSQISPALGKFNQGKLNVVVDTIILFAVSAAIASSFGTSVLNMGGGVNSLTGIDNGRTLWIIITIIGTIAFIVSSSTGLLRGIKVLADFNIYIYYIIIGILILLGPTVYMFSVGTESFGGFLTNFFEKALFTGTAANDDWSSSWTTFYWSNWIAWAPVTAVFLARIAYGYKVKEIIMMNFVIPGFFSIIWMTVLSGSAINFQMTGKVDIASIMNEQGTGAAAYAVLEQLPFSGIIIALYLVAVMLSFITATDSTTNAMAGISSKGISQGTQEAPVIIKIVWGLIVAAIALIFIIAFDIEGIKTLSYLGGFPALFLGILSILSLIFIMKNPQKFDSFSKKED